MHDQTRRTFLLLGALCVPSRAEQRGHSWRHLSGRCISIFNVAEQIYNESPSGCGRQPALRRASGESAGGFQWR